MAFRELAERSMHGPTLSDVSAYCDTTLRAREAALPAVIEIRGTSQDLPRLRRGSTVALDGFDMTGGARQVHGFLAPNGFRARPPPLRALLGLVRPDSAR